MIKRTWSKENHNVKEIIKSGEFAFSFFYISMELAPILNHIFDMVGIQLYPDASDYCEKLVLRHLQPYFTPNPKLLSAFGFDWVNHLNIYNFLMPTRMRRYRTRRWQAHGDTSCLPPSPYKGESTCNDK